MEIRKTFQKTEPAFLSEFLCSAPLDSPKASAVIIHFNKNVLDLNRTYGKKHLTKY